MLIVINLLLHTWAAVAKPANPVSSFERSPARAKTFIVSDRTIANNTYLLPMTLPKRSQFAKVSISFTEQNRDQTITPIPFDLFSTKAFVGTSKDGGRAIAIQKTWIDEAGVLWVQFKTPLPPQTKLTLALKLRRQSAVARYDYSIAAYPADAAAVFVGDGALTLQR
ncbi:MAG: DUF2808 domain-containing protein [Stenomitos frigidus ULC029]